MHVAYQTDCALLLWEQTVPLLENVHLSLSLIIFTDLYPAIPLKSLICINSSICLL